MKSARRQPKSALGTDTPMIEKTLEHPGKTVLTPLSSDKIQTVTSSTFTRVVLEAEGPIAVEFMSYGCAHCRAIEPVLEQVAKMVEPRERVFRVIITSQSNRNSQAATKSRARQLWSCFLTGMRLDESKIHPPPYRAS
jgi:thiol-disulfide isomerase/thioredoxin